MRLFIHCPAASESAKDLVVGLRAAGVNAYRLRRDSPHSGWRDSDKVLCWGTELARSGVMNSVPYMTKLDELEKLSANGVYVPPFSRTPREGYLARSAHHQCGNDLLRGCASPHFYTKKLDVEREYRVHVANGLSIRVGMKRPHATDPHPWVRSYDGGWHIDYGARGREGFKDAGRALAKQAVQVLGLALAAVDLWKLRDGTWCVGEVNRRPALGNGTLAKYVAVVKAMVSP